MTSIIGSTGVHIVDINSDAEAQHLKSPSWNESFLWIMKDEFRIITVHLIKDICEIKRQTTSLSPPAVIFHWQSTF